MSASVAFDKARAEGRAALIGYLPAGFPTVQGGIAAVRALAESGVDLIEVGFPYSDPVIDGPVIQRATEIALANGVRAADVLRTVEAAAQAGVPVLVMTYWNLVERYSAKLASRASNSAAKLASRASNSAAKLASRASGAAGGRPSRGVDSFARDLAAAGGSGLITPDLIPDEAEEWLAASDEHALDRVFLVAPSSTDARIAATVAACRGFVYATSVMGVTGARDTTSQAAPALVARVRQAVAVANPGLPIGVGLGVRDGDQAAELGSFADGVIVGSALVQCLLGAEESAGLVALRELGAALAAGVRRTPRPT